MKYPFQYNFLTLRDLMANLGQEPEDILHICANTFPSCDQSITIDPNPGKTVVRKIQPKDVFPKIRRIVYNDPATKVWFDDGTSVLVKTSSEDKFSKEIGLIYAIVKRLFGTPDEKGQVKSDGYMCELKRLSESAYDQKAAEKARAKEKSPGARKNGPAKSVPSKDAKKPAGRKRA